ncbi:GlxA family transcriptional regulator [Curvivirga sp.]|uniref:GlxA family transcriptional regulator n=1 Tax=Curvivirga sp. TaxID=2856848 RepID=UPI003B5CDCD9
MKKVSYILADGFAPTSFSLSMEALAVANDLSAEECYSYNILSVSETQSTARSYNHISVQVEGSFRLASQSDAIIICAYQNAALYKNPAFSSFLRQQARIGKTIAALSGGSFLLAHAGLLNTKRCSLAGEYAQLFKELHPNISVLADVFTIESNILTCAGGLSALDMMIYLIRQDFGKALSQKVSDRFLYEKFRSPEETRNSQRYLSLRMQSAYLGQAVELMEKNIDTPLDIETLAFQVGTTARNLELVFKKYLNKTPNAYYREARLNHAYQMIVETRLPITVIAQASGFASSSYFSKCFAKLYGLQPTNIRKSEM